MYKNVLSDLKFRITITKSLKETHLEASSSNFSSDAKDDHEVRNMNFSKDITYSNSYYGTLDSFLINTENPLSSYSFADTPLDNVHNTLRNDIISFLFSGFNISNPNNEFTFSNSGLSKIIETAKRKMKNINNGVETVTSSSFSGYG